MLTDDGISYANTIIRNAVSEYITTNTVEAYCKCLDTFTRRIIEDGTILALANIDEEGNSTLLIAEIDGTQALVVYTDKAALKNTDAIIIETYLDDVLDFAQSIGVDGLFVDPDDQFFHLTLGAVNEILVHSSQITQPFNINAIVAYDDYKDEPVLPPPEAELQREPDGAPVIPMKYYLDALDLAAKEGKDKICFPGGYSPDMDVADEVIACISSLYAWEGMNPETSMNITIACKNTSVLSLYTGMRREINSDRFEEYHRRHNRHETV